MSAGSERALAITAGSDIFRTAWEAADAEGKTGGRVMAGIAALIDAGWIPPAQRNEELRQIAGWMRDARIAFRAIEAVAADLDGGVVGDVHPIAHDWNIARRLRDALGDRFTTPKEIKS